MLRTHLERYETRRFVRLHCAFIKYLKVGHNYDEMGQFDEESYSGKNAIQMGAGQKAFRYERRSDWKETAWRLEEMGRGLARVENLAAVRQNSEAEEKAGESESAKGSIDTRGKNRETVHCKVLSIGRKVA